MRYGIEVTSYSTHLSDAGLPSHFVMTVPASPSIAATAIVTSTVGVSAAGPQRNAAPTPGARTVTLEWAFQAEYSIARSSPHKLRLLG